FRERPEPLPGPRAVHFFRRWCRATLLLTRSPGTTASFRSALSPALPLAGSSSRILVFPVFMLSTPSARFSFSFSCCQFHARRPGKNVRNKIPGAVCRRECVLFLANTLFLQPSRLTCSRFYSVA